MKDTVDVTVRTRPKYSTFIFLGVILGFIAAVILILLPVDTSKLPQEYSTATVLGVLMAFLGIVGGFLGAIAALIIERVTSSRTKVYTVPAQYEEVAAAPEPDAAETAQPADDAAAGDAEAQGASAPEDHEPKTIRDAGESPDKSVEQ